MAWKQWHGDSHIDLDNFIIQKTAWEQIPNFMNYFLHFILKIFTKPFNSMLFLFN